MLPPALWVFPASEREQLRSDSFNGRCQPVSRAFKRHSVIPWMISLCGTSEIIRVWSSSHNTVWLKDRETYGHSLYTDFAGEHRENPTVCKRHFLASFATAWMLLTVDKMELVGNRLHISTQSFALFKLLHRSVKEVKSPQDVKHANIY